MVKIHIAIVGSGPSGFYAAEALLRSDLNVEVNMIEKLPTPFGLVRSGVAPDHPKLKQSILVYERILQQDGINFFGNVTVDQDVSIEELLRTHHGVIMACGAPLDNKLNIPGEDLRGSHAATAFVGWYNGHPDYRDQEFNFKQKAAIVIGHGNVAADVCRILSKPVSELQKSDIAEHALDALSESEIQEIHIIGRRGPVQAKFSPKELRELADIPNFTTEVDANDCDIGEQCEVELQDPKNITSGKNLELFRSFSDLQSGHELPSNQLGKIKFRFYLTPQKIHGTETVEGMSFSKNQLDGQAFSQKVVTTGQTERIPCGLVFRSIGYRGVPFNDIPFNEVQGKIPNEQGRVIKNGEPMQGVYVTGWQKRGPTGIIGTNRADSIETVECLLADMIGDEITPKPGAGELRAIVEKRHVQIVGLEDWKKIDTSEIDRGKKFGKPREKFTRVDEMLDVLSI